MAVTRGSVDQHGPLRVTTLAVATLLAMVATGILVLSDDPRLLRLAVLATLWAFLATTIAMTRRDTGAGELSGEALELRRAYQMELEREVAARREYELRLEVQLRRELDESTQQEVETLRRDVVTLHRELVERLGSLPSRAALRAASTRLSDAGLLALPDQPHPVEDRPAGGPPPDAHELPVPVQPADRSAESAGPSADRSTDRSTGHPDRALAAEAPSEVTGTGWAELRSSGLPPWGAPRTEAGPPTNGVNVGPTGTYNGTYSGTGYGVATGPGTGPGNRSGSESESGLEHGRHDRPTGAEPGDGGPTPRRPRRYREESGEDTLTRLLADQVGQSVRGVELTPRRRRYREDDEDNEVLSRVLGQ